MMGSEEIQRDYGAERMYEEKRLSAMEAPGSRMAGQAVSPMQNAFHQLEAEIDVQAKVVSELLERLQPVLAKPKGNATGGSDVASSNDGISPMAESVRRSAGRVASSTAALKMILAMLEL